MSHTNISCPHCTRKFARKQALTQHLKLNRCPILKNLPDSQTTSTLVTTKAVAGTTVVDTLPAIASSASASSVSASLASASSASPSAPATDLNQILKEFETFKQTMYTMVSQMSQPSPAPTPYNQYINNSNNLQVMCLNSNENLFDVLISQSDLKTALTYIRGCALARLAGDCRFIEKMYLTGERPVIMYGNKSKTQFVYYNEKNERVVETNAKVLARKLAYCLQRSYLKSVNIYDIEGKVKEDAPFDTRLIDPLDAYDLQIWNSHIYELNDEKYQKKILSSIRIPFETDQPMNLSNSQTGSVS